MTSIDGCMAHALPLRADDDRRIRLILVENHTILREGLKALLELESDVLVVAEYACAESSLDGIRELRPDVVVVDIALPNRSGIELLSEIAHLSPRSRKLMLTGSNGAEYIRAALNAGADGYVLKDARSAEILHAIRTVALGQRFLCKASVSNVVSSFLLHNGPQPSPNPSKLPSDRELEVLVRVAHGHSNKMIARDLGLSHKTVDRHRCNVMRKLDLHDAASLTRYALKHGLLGNDSPDFFSAKQSPALASQGLV